MALFYCLLLHSPAHPAALLDRKDKQASNLACLWATDGKNKVVFI